MLINVRLQNIFTERKLKQFNMTKQKTLQFSVKDLILIELSWSRDTV